MNAFHRSLRETWRELSPAQRNLLAGLTHGPRTQADLRANQRVQANTLRAAEAAHLVRRHWLRMGPLLNDELDEFVILTRLGRAVHWAGERFARKHV